jgi:uncharacterized membrane protein YheB (UPF0754 family)
LLIPVLSGLVGYGTNVLAVWMTFSPLEFWPVKIWQPWGLFGWQGIIPAKAVHMTEILCDVFMNKVVDVNEVFSRLDPKHIAALTHSKMEVRCSTACLASRPSVRQPTDTPLVAAM